MSAFMGSSLGPPPAEAAGLVSRAARAPWVIDDPALPQSSIILWQSEDRASVVELWGLFVARVQVLITPV